MISLRKSANELDRCRDLYDAAVDAYERALRAVSRYSIEVDSGEAATFRRGIDALAQEWRPAGSSAAIKTVQTSLETALREYQERAGARLTRLRKDLEASAKAMETFAASVVNSGEDHQEEIEDELARLARSAESGSAEEMRRAIRVAQAEIGESLSRIKRGNQLVVAQLQDEIRLLHQAVPAETKKAAAEPAPSNRRMADEKIAELLRENQPFCVLFVDVRNLDRVEARHSTAVAEAALKPLVRRMQTALGAQAVIACRWSRRIVMGILEPPPGGCMALTREVTRALNGSYSVQENGMSCEVILEVTAGVLDRGRDTDSAAFSKKLAQLAAALEKA